MGECAALQEIPPEDYRPLMDDLNSDLPNSLHIWSFLKTIERWKKHDPHLYAKILAINGDFRRKFIIVYTAPTDLSDFQGAIHKWSHQSQDESIVRESLKNTKVFPWQNPKLLLTGLSPETANAVLPVLSELLDEGSWFSQPDRVYWMRKEFAEKWTIEAPQGTYVSFLNQSHAAEIDEHWPHKYDGSLNLITTMICVNFGIGLFDSSTNELMSWALHWFYGAIGVLHTKEQHRKKGYAGVVIRGISREIAKRGGDVFLEIASTNIPSLNLAEKLGFNLLMKGTWIFKGF